MDFFPNEEEYDSDKYHKCKCLYQIHFLLHLLTYKQFNYSFIPLCWVCFEKQVKSKTIERKNK